MNEIKDIIKLLKKTLPLLLANPKIMAGCDISEQEIEEIIKTKSLSLEILQHVAGDKFFQDFHDELGLSEYEARKIADFLYKSAPYFIEDLKEDIPYIKE